MPISNESQYCIDSMVELCRITPDVAQWAYHCNIDVDGILDNIRGESNLENAIRNRFAAEYQSLSPLDKAYIGFGGLLSMEIQFNEISRSLIHGLTEPTELKDRIHNDSLIMNWINLVNQMWERVREDTLTYNIREIVDIEIARRHANMNRHIGLAEARAAIIEKPKVNETDKKIGKKVLKKSTKFLEKVAGVENVRLFLSNKSFSIFGNDFGFRFSKSDYSLIRHSADPIGRCHIPYKLDLLTLAGEVMASGCIYLKDTPVLDQISGIILHIKSGNEREIVKTTNWWDTTAFFDSHPLIIEIHKEKNKNSIIDIDRQRLARIMQASNEEVNRTEAFIPMALEAIKQELNIPENVVNFMIKPGIRFDELQMLDISFNVQNVLDRTLGLLT